MAGYNLNDVFSTGVWATPQEALDRLSPAGQQAARGVYGNMLNPTDANQARSIWNVLNDADKAAFLGGNLDPANVQKAITTGDVSLAPAKSGSMFGDLAGVIGPFALAAGVGGAMGGAFGSLPGAGSSFGAQIPGEFGLADASWGVNPAAGSNTVSFTGSIPGGSSNMQSIWQAAQPGATATGGGGVNLTDFYDAMDAGDAAVGIGSTPPAGGFFNPNMYGGNVLQQIFGAGSSFPGVPGLGNIGGGSSGTDWASLLGKLGSAGVSYLGNQNLSSALTNIANQGRNDRAPFLEAAKTAMADPNAWAQTGPAQQLFKQQWAQLSPVFGNPAGAPAAQGIAADAGLRGWQNYVTGMGNLGLGNQANTQNLQAQAAQAANDTAPFGAAIQAATAPAQPDWMKLFGLKGFA